MNPIKRILGTILAITLLTSCASTETAISEALNLIENNKAKCVLIQDREIIATYNGKGVSPLLQVYRKNTQAMNGGIIVDKVIGRAAAFIAIKGGAKEVHTPLVSESAKTLLKKHGIKIEYTKIVPEILNRERDGLCPLEESVLGETDPDKALNKIHKQIEILMNKNKHRSSH